MGGSFLKRIKGELKEKALAGHRRMMTREVEKLVFFYAVGEMGVVRV